MKTFVVATCMESDEQLLELWELIGDENLRRLGEGGQPRGMAPLRSDQDRKNAISSCLMAAYRETGNDVAFELLVELNHKPLLSVIRNRLRGGIVRIDPRDVLQDAFVNICRYHGSYRCERSNSFRVWSQRIANNAAISRLKRESKYVTQGHLETSSAEPIDQHSRSPYRAASEAESAQLVNLAYLTYLNIYLRVYQQRTEKERRALSLVEVKGATYKQTAAALGIRMESLKMLIFRARRKIYRGVDQYLRELSQPVPAP